MAHDAQLDELQQVALVLVAGIDEDARLGTDLEDGAAGFHAVHARHGDVHDDQVGRQGGGQAHGFLAVGGHAGHTQMAVGGQQAADALHEQFVIVHQQDAANVVHGYLPLRCAGRPRKGTWWPARGR